MGANDERPRAGSQRRGAQAPLLAGAPRARCLRRGARRPDHVLSRRVPGRTAPHDGGSRPLADRRGDRLHRQRRRPGGARALGGALPARRRRRLGSGLHRVRRGYRLPARPRLRRGGLRLRRRGGGRRRSARARGGAPGRGGRGRLPRPARGALERGRGSLFRARDTTRGMARPQRRDRLRRRHRALRRDEPRRRARSGRRPAWRPWPSRRSSSRASRSRRSSR